MLLKEKRNLNREHFSSCDQITNEVRLLDPKLSTQIK